MAKQTYDVIVVGSGAAGGMLSASLAHQGASVLVVEGGPQINTRTDFNTHALPFDFPDRRIPVMKPGKQGFESERARGIGGKTMLWNAMALRFSQRDLKGRTLEGVGADWPFDYKDIAPYYDQVEKEIGVCGNLDYLEDLPDGVFLPPAPLKCADRIVQAGAAKLGVRLVHARKATRTVAGNGRPACHYCGNCMAGCDVVAKYNSADVHLAPALKTGKLKILANSIVAEVLVSSENRATGVRYLDRTSRTEGEARARCVVVACACAQSVALLLMSKSRLYPEGLANSSGQLGRNFIPHFTGRVECFLKELIGITPVNDEGFLDHGYVPSFVHGRKRNYARSFGINYGYDNHRYVGWARSVSGFGKGRKEYIRARYPAFLALNPFGEMLPNQGSYIDLDPQRKDDYGLPVTRRHVHFAENERAMFTDMTQWTVEILKSSGAEIHSVQPEPGLNHELGGCRMGPDPKTSVLNAFCQAHDLANLYVVDGSVFPTASEKNPTLTILALAARTADRVADRFRKREM